MTTNLSKKLEELLSLAPVDSKTPNDDISLDEPDKDIQLSIEESRQLLTKIDETIDKIDEALPMVKTLSASDTEMDDIAAMAISAFKDLNDLGMNVEPRYSGVIFQTAAQMLGHAITAKKAKIDKNLSIVDLQLKKRRLDYQMEKDSRENKSNDTDNVSTGTGIVLDRNELLRNIIEAHTKKES